MTDSAAGTTPQRAARSRSRLLSPDVQVWVIVVAVAALLVVCFALVPWRTESLRDAPGGAGLGAMWGKELALEMLSDAGFGDVTVEDLDHDPQNYYYIMTK